MGACRPFRMEGSPRRRSVATDDQRGGSGREQMGDGCRRIVRRLTRAVQRARAGAQGAGGAHGSMVGTPPLAINVAAAGRPCLYGLVPRGNGDRNRDGFGELWPVIRGPRLVLRSV